jgi:hypothetical protein
MATTRSNSLAGLDRTQFGLLLAGAFAVLLAVLGVVGVFTMTTESILVLGVVAVVAFGAVTATFLSGRSSNEPPET